MFKIVPILIYKVFPMVYYAFLAHIIHVVLLNIAEKIC